LFHISINLQIGVIIYYSLNSLFFIYYAIFLYEGTDLINYNFYTPHNVSAIDEVANGQMIDYCSNTSSLRTYFNFDQYNDLFQNFVTQTTTIRDKYNVTFNSTVYNEFEDKSNNLNVNEFIAVQNKSIYWDIEQINYYLFPLSLYKFFNKRNSIIK
jgi:hypothetical protein